MTVRPTNNHQMRTRLQHQRWRLSCLQFRPLSPTTSQPDLLKVVSGYENFLTEFGGDTTVNKAEGYQGRRRKFNLMGWC